MAVSRIFGCAGVDRLNLFGILPEPFSDAVFSRYTRLKNLPINTWRGVREEVIRRINTRIWKPGDSLPHEVALADEFGCARSTVNRALQAVADEGYVERRRRGGTRVTVHPERKATFGIPLIRSQIEVRGCHYDYQLLKRRLVRPTKTIASAMRVNEEEKLLHLRSLHRADNLPFVLENRWISLQTVPTASDVDFRTQSPNEWLLEHVPVSEGVLSFFARSASTQETEELGCVPGEALIVEERLTQNAMGDSITWVQLTYCPGYRTTIKF